MYEHGVCIAAIVNLAPGLEDVAGMAADRAISLFHSLAQRSARGAGGAAAPLWADLARLLLGSVDATLQSGAGHNPELLYALLQRQEVFSPWAQHPQLGGHARNVLAICAWLEARLDVDRLAAQERAVAWGAAEVLARIRIHAADWKGEQLQPSQQLRFSFAEETHPWHFHLPCAWACVVEARIPSEWASGSLVLLPPPEHPPAAADAEASLQGVSVR